jgi:hypothetical protein
MEYVTLLSSNATTAIFSVETPGIYQFHYRYTENDCWYWIHSEEIIVPVRTDFAYSVQCANGQYNLTVYNNSEYLPAIANVNIISDAVSVNGSTAVVNGHLSVYSDVALPSTNTITWTVSSENATTGIPFHDCSKTISFELPPYPTAAFTLSEATKCPEDFFHLQPANYNPNGVNNKYLWTFQQSGQTPITNNLPVIDFMPPVAGYYDITLTEWNDYGCAVTSTPITVYVHNSKLEVTVARTPSGNLCQGDYVDLKLLDTDNADLNYLPHYQWMNGHSELAGENGATLQVTQSGAYWARLITADGCEAVFPGISMQPLRVEFGYAPDVKINAPAGVCKDCGGFWLEATVSNPQPNMQYRWSSANGTIANNAVWETVTNNTGIIRTFVSLSQNASFSSDTYTIQIRYAGNGCSASASSAVQFSPSPSPSSLTYTLDIPTYRATGLYSASITARSGLPGTYIWSNGMTGNSITVNHGGVYEVTFVNQYGCSSKAEITLPRDPKEYMWIVPQGGCYTVCDDEGLRVIGPVSYAQFYKWAWMWSRTNLLNYTGSVLNNYIIAPYSGDHTLELTVADDIGNKLDAQSKPFSVNFIDCKRDCDFNANISITKDNNEYYISYSVTITLTNSYPFDLNIIFNTSPSGAGFFIPAAVTLPAGSTQTYHLTYIATDTSNPVVFLNIIAENLYSKDEGFRCRKSYEMSMPIIKAPRVPDTPEYPDTENILFALNPNPANGNITISYNVPQKGNNQISIYNISGKLIWSSNPAVDTENSSTLNVSAWVSGYYIAVLKHNGNIVKQQVIIKK